MTGMHQGLSAGAPLPSRSHPPALKRGTFYFAQKRNFLLCLDMNAEMLGEPRRIVGEKSRLHQLSG